MATLTYEDIRELHEAGADAGSIHAALQQDPRHVRNCWATHGDSDVIDLKHVLVVRLRALGQGADRSWVGGLVQAVAALPDQHPLQLAFAMLLPQFETVNSRVRCHDDPEIGALVTGMTELAKTIPDADPDKIQTEMDALTGGRIWAAVTVADVQAVIDDHAATEAREELEREWATAMNEGGIGDAISLGDRTAMVAAMRTEADRIEAG